LFGVAGGLGPRLPRGVCSRSGGEIKVQPVVAHGVGWRGVPVQAGLRPMGELARVWSLRNGLRLFGEEGEEPEGRADGFAVGVSEGVDGVAVGDGQAGVGMDDGGLAAEAGAALEGGNGGHFEEVVIAGAAVVFDVGFDEWEEDSARFHFGIGQADLAHEFGAAHFEPFERA
jgi:hypothetical protein